MKLRRIYRLAHGVGWFWILLGVGVIAGMLLSTALVGIPRAEHPPIFGPHSLEFLDLAAQRSMSDAAWWMVIITGASSAVAAGGLFLIYGTLKEARRSADAAREAVEASEKATLVAREIGQAQVRAYIMVSDISLNRDNHHNFIVKLNFVNSGQTPATKIWISLQIFIETDDAEEPTHVDDLNEPHFDLAGGGRGEVEFISKALYGAVDAAQKANVILDVEILYDDIFSQLGPNDEGRNLEASYYGSVTTQWGAIELFRDMT